MKLKNNKIVLIANGDFPYHNKPIEALNKADVIICCDGASTNAIKHGYKPDCVVGDLDSINNDLIKSNGIKLVNLPKQNENDLRKTLMWINEQGGQAVDIVGATGKRDDHTIANIFSICQLRIELNMKIITDYGEFIPLFNEMVLKTYQKQAISFFVTSKKTKITARNLEYPLNKAQFTNLYEGSLNIATENKLEVTVENGNALIFLEHEGLDNE